VRATVADFHKWWRTVMRPDFKTPLVSETGLRALLKPRIPTAPGSAYYFAQGMQVIPSKQAGGFPTQLSYCGESYCTTTCNIMETSSDGADQVIVSSWTNHQIYVLPQATFVELAGLNDYDVPLSPFADPALPWFSLAPPANGLGTFAQSATIASNGASKLLAEYTGPTPKPTPAPPTPPPTPPAPATPAPSWSACPPGQGGNDCTTFRFPLDRAGSIAGNVSVFVRRFYPVGGPTGKSLWMVSGGPGDSGNDFSGGAAHWATELNLTVYTFDQRGIGLSSAINCESPPGFGFDAYNTTFLAAVKACNREIIEAHGAERLAFFSTHDAATDLVDMVAAVAPISVYIYALSYGTYFTNTYLQLENMRVDALILDGPVAPDRWPLENNGEWASHVHGDLLRACASASDTCEAQLGSVAHLPRLTMDALVDGTLPCLARLPWLRSQLVAGWAAYLSADVRAHVLAGPLWHRLLRCNGTDIAQLEHFKEFRAGADAPHPGLNKSYTYGLSVVRGASELYSFAAPDNPAGGGASGGPPPPLSWKEQVTRSHRLLADAHPELDISFGRNVSKWPLYTPNPATHRRYAKLPDKLPALLMVGNLDPQTPHGLGIWFQRGLGGASAIKMLTVPWAAHGTVNPIYPCSFGIASAFFKDPFVPVDTRCLAEVPTPDFDGANSQTQAISASAFGTKDLWNNAADPAPPRDLYKCVAGQCKVMSTGVTMLACSAACHPSPAPAPSASGLPVGLGLGLGLPAAAAVAALSRRKRAGAATGAQSAAVAEGGAAHAIELETNPGIDTSNGI
jgi:pimeloyl-ACP methyl ester carboxylesterase